jgi:hypothetical protein
VAYGLQLAVPFRKMRERHYDAITARDDDQGANITMKTSPETMPISPQCRLIVQHSFSGAPDLIPLKQSNNLI